MTMSGGEFERHTSQFSRQLGYRGLFPSRLDALRGASFDGVVFLGIGGSALPAEIVRNVREEIGLAVPLVTWRDYGLPARASQWQAGLPAKNPEHMRRPLFIVVSFSGNTAETLSSLRGLLARLKGASRRRVAIVTAGGALLNTATEKKIPLVRFDADGLAPRQGTGRMFYSIAAILRAARLIPRPAPTFTHLSSGAFRAQGLRLARAARNRLVVIYTRASAEFIGYLWKIRCNENAKTPAFNNIIPEIDHNEIVGFERKQFLVAAIFLEEREFGKALSRQIDITKKILSRYRVKPVTVALRGNTLLEKTWNAVMLADWFSYFLAREHGVDPMEIHVINELKKELAR